MKSSSIQAIFFDVGNTLRVSHADVAHQTAARKKIAELLGTSEDPEGFCDRIDQRYKKYRKWAFDNLREVDEIELWTKWLAPDFPAELAAKNAVDLTFQYRQTVGRREMPPDAVPTIKELFARGYTLGIISNVITSREIPDWLIEDQLEPYFKSVVLSATFGIRKPDPRIYHHAAELAGMSPESCAYVGDNLNRDVVGTKDAGFGMAIILTGDRIRVEPVENEIRPDLIIHKLADLLDAFPPLHSSSLSQR